MTRAIRASPLVAILALVLSHVSGACAQPSEGWRLVFKTTTIEEQLELPGVKSAATAEETGKPQEAVSETVVRLAPTWFSIQDGARESIYDCATKRLYEVDREARTFEDISLYADIGLREHEMKNRRYLQRILHESPSVRAMDVLEAECELGVEATPPAGGDIQESAVDGVREFRLNGEPRVRYRSADNPLPEAVRPGLRRFLAHGVQIHPRIAERIESGESAPAMIEYVVRLMARQRTIRLELTESAAESVDWKGRLGGLRRVGANGCLPDGTATPDLEKTPTFEQYQAASAEAFEQGDMLDAMLIQFEVGIALGRHDVQRVREVREAGADDAGLATLLAALDAKDQTQALKLFDSIDVTSVQRVHVLNVFRANAMAGAGDVDAGIQLMRKTILASPYLTGAYFDLGGLLHKSYETPAAWECWDAARRIAPGHPMLKRVNELEAHLVEAYPRFF